MRLWLERLAVVGGALLVVLGIWTLTSPTMRPLPPTDMAIFAAGIVVAVAVMTLFTMRAIDTRSGARRFEYLAKAFAAGSCLWFWFFVVTPASSSYVAFGGELSSPAAALEGASTRLPIVGAVLAILATLLAGSARRTWTRIGGGVILLGALSAAAFALFAPPMPAPAGCVACWPTQQLELLMVGLPALVTSVVVVWSTLVRPSDDEDRPVGALLHALAGV